MQNSKKTNPRWGKYILPLIKSIARAGTPQNRRNKLNPAVWISLLVAILSLSACTTTKNPVYFRDLPRDTILRNVVAENYQLKIQKNDILGITVASLSPDVAFYNNLPANSTLTPAGYLVDGNGNISFAKLGSLHVEGMTRKELKDTLEKNLVPYLKDVMVNITFQNRHVTVLGGVTPKVLPMADDNMTILDALAATGDIGEKGKIDNVLVIRDSTGAKEFKRLNLEDHSVFYSPYYYLQPNDVVYVEPAKVKAKVSTVQLISIITSAVSLIILILNTVKL